MKQSRTRKVIIGIDGGGSSTECLITDIHGRKLGSGLSVGSNIHNVGKEVAINSLISAVSEAGLSDKDDVLVVCAGLSGANRYGINHTEKDVINQIIPQAKSILIVNDAVNALAGAIGLREGICINSGTGSFGVGWDNNLNLFFTSGYGPLLGDEGSGYWIGLKGLIAGLRYFDKRSKPTILLNTFLSALNISSPYDVSRVINQSKNPQETISALCPLVIQCAEYGDDVAKEILKMAAKELSLNAFAIASRLSLSDSEVDISFVGKVFDNNNILMKNLHGGIKKLLPKAKIISPRFSPVIGSIILAFNNINLNLDYEVLNLSDSAKK